MDYYTVPKPSTSFYTVPSDGKTFYTVSVVSKTWYNVFRTSVRTWVELCDIASWKKLCEMGLDTWAKLYAAKIITVYHRVDNPTTSWYEVT